MLISFEERPLLYLWTRWYWSVTQWGLCQDICTVFYVPLLAIIINPDVKWSYSTLIFSDSKFLWSELEAVQVARFTLLAVDAKVLPLTTDVNKPQPSLSGIVGQMTEVVNTVTTRPYMPAHKAERAIELLLCFMSELGTLTGKSISTTSRHISTGVNNWNGYEFVPFTMSPNLKCQVHILCYQYLFMHPWFPCPSFNLLIVPWGTLHTNWCVTYHFRVSSSKVKVTVQDKNVIKVKCHLFSFHFLITRETLMNLAHICTRDISMHFTHINMNYH